MTSDKDPFLPAFMRSTVVAKEAVDRARILHNRRKNKAARKQRKLTKGG